MTKISNVDKLAISFKDLRNDRAGKEIYAGENGVAYFLKVFATYSTAVRALERGQAELTQSYTAMITDLNKEKEKDLKDANKVLQDALDAKKRLDKDASETEKAKVDADIQKAQAALSEKEQIWSAKLSNYKATSENAATLMSYLSQTAASVALIGKTMVGISDLIASLLAR